jgi:hypothetical protein
MYVIFLLPLVMSLCAAVFALVWDFSRPTKCGIVALVAFAAALQFVPALQQSIHFLVPLFLQMLACGWCFYAARPY